MTPLYFLARALPKNLVSFIAGKLAFLPLPQLLLRPLLKHYCKLYRAVPEEAARPLNEYHSLGEFFIRDLAPGVRAIGNGVVSPVDAKVTQFGEITDGRLLQVKGKTYGLTDLVGDRQLAQSFDGGFFVTLYLAPGDYHHVHSPVNGTITDSYYLPGTLWPVNGWSTANVDNLFCLNERVNTVIRGEHGIVAVIKVGALNVGSIVPSYDSFVTNTLARIFHPKSAVVHRHYEPPLPIARGERLGTFRLGSTVVLLFQRGSFLPGKNLALGPIRLGAKLDAGAN